MSENHLRVVNEDSSWSPKYYGVFVGLFSGLYMITMAVTPKIFDFFGTPVNAAMIVFPLCCIITDVLTEVYGFNRARQAIWTVLVCIGLFGLFTQIAIALPPTPVWDMQEEFVSVFDMSIRYVVAGWGAWLVGEMVNSYVMSKMKIFQKGERMSVRFIGSTVIGQFGDTIVFALIAYAGILSFKELLVLIVISWGIKIAYEIICLPLSIPLTNWVKRLEGVDHFDNQEISIV